MPKRLTAQQIGQFERQGYLSSLRALTEAEALAIRTRLENFERHQAGPLRGALHHVRIIHGSPPSTSAERRIDFAIRYIPTCVRRLQGDDSATLVRGVDDFRTFEHEPRPTCDLDPSMPAMHEAIARRNAQILYKGGIEKF